LAMQRVEVSLDRCGEVKLRMMSDSQREAVMPIRENKLPGRVLLHSDSVWTVLWQLCFESLKP
jgi:hypothetical protein